VEECLRRVCCCERALGPNPLLLSVHLRDEMSSRKPVWKLQRLRVRPASPINYISYMEHAGRRHADGVSLTTIAEELTSGYDTNKDSKNIHTCSACLSTLCPGQQALAKHSSQCIQVALGKQRAMIIALASTLHQLGLHQTGHAPQDATLGQVTGVSQLSCTHSQAGSSTWKTRHGGWLFRRYT
jgi:hypothetical protein